MIRLCASDSPHVVALEALPSRVGVSRCPAWRIGRRVQAATDVPVDGSQEGGGTGRLRGKRADAASRKGDAGGPGHKSTLSCFGMANVVDDDIDSSLDEGPLLIEVRATGTVLDYFQAELLAGRPGCRLSCMWQPVSQVAFACCEP